VRERRHTHLESNAGKAAEGFDVDDYDSMPDAIGHQLYTISWVKLAGAACIISHLLPSVITIPKTLPNIAISSVSRKKQIQNVGGRSPERLEYSDLSRSFQNGGVHGHCHDYKTYA
jgi:hypothetical protein